MQSRQKAQKTRANYHVQIHSSLQIKVGGALSHVPYTPAGRVG